MKTTIMKIVRLLITAIMACVAALLTMLIFGEPSGDMPLAAFALLKLASLAGACLYWRALGLLRRRRLLPDFICDGIDKAMEEEI